MTLKQEFLDMLSLLNPNITEYSYDEDYVIETDFFMEICKKTGEEITYSSACSDCEYCSENCKYKLYKFDEDYRKDHDWKKETFTGGDFHNVGVQSVIHIYDSWSRNIADMKQTIRHEILHYLLWCIAPLSNLCKDDSGVFHYFCKIYDAYAYKGLDENNTKVFEGLQEFSKEEVNVFLKQLLENDKSKGVA